MYILLLVLLIILPFVISYSVYLLYCLIGIHCLIHPYLSKVWYQVYISFTSIWDTDTVSCY